MARVRRAGEIARRGAPAGLAGGSPEPGPQSGGRLARSVGRGAGRPAPAPSGQLRSGRIPACVGRCGAARKLDAARCELIDRPPAAQVRARSGKPLPLRAGREAGSQQSQDRSKVVETPDVRSPSRRHPCAPAFDGPRMRSGRPRHDGNGQAANQRRDSHRHEPMLEAVVAAVERGSEVRHRRSAA